MRYLKFAALLGVLLFAAGNAHAAQVRVGIGVGPAYVSSEPVCAYGYYPYYPYACAPYGFWGPSYFVGGVFIGAGPWYHGWGQGYYGHGYYGRPGYGYYGHGYRPKYGDRPGYSYRGAPAHGYAGGGFHGHGGGDSHGHAGGEFHGGGGFHGGGAGHGGGHR